MHSPEENIQNGIKRSADNEDNFSLYERTIWLLHKVEIALLILLLLQTLLFYRLYYIWGGLEVYKVFFSYLESKNLAGETTILLIWLIQAVHVLVTLIIIKRLKRILKTEVHSFKNILTYFVFQLILLNLIPSYLNGAISLFLISIGLSVYFKHKAT
ncbi:MAG: hypothetical protein H6599_09170 [Flavobacteriales bacterium]|nr:hypothetical protein [Flavobacteriales bacterium]